GDWLWSFLSQKHLDLLQQRGEEVFLLKARDNVFAAVHRAKPSHDNHRDFRMFFMHLARQFYAIHAFHTEVSDKNVKILFVELAQCILAIVGAHRAVALHFQNLAAQTRQHFMVIDKQDGSHETSS